MRAERTLAIFNLVLCAWALVMLSGELLFCTFLILTSLFGVADRIQTKLNEIQAELKS